MRKLDIHTLDFIRRTFEEKETKVQSEVANLLKKAGKLNTDPYNVIKQIAKDQRNPQSALNQHNSEEMLQTLLNEEEKALFEKKRS
jgi:hypothetical protein